MGEYYPKMNKSETNIEVSAPENIQIVKDKM